MNKDYKRLTKWECKGCASVNGTSPIDRDFSEAINRLAELEDKIENGTLVELPCKVEEIMYQVIEGMPIQEWKMESICFNRLYPKGVIWAVRTSDFAHWKFWAEDCGTKWFVTKAEAEAKLRELEGEQQ